MDARRLEKELRHLLEAWDGPLSRQDLLRWLNANSRSPKPVTNENESDTATLPRIKRGAPNPDQRPLTRAETERRCVEHVIIVCFAPPMLRDRGGV